MTGRALSGAWPAPTPVALDLRVEGPDVAVRPTRTFAACFQAA